MNETHDSLLRSWVASANEPGAEFPIQNLPFGVFSVPRGSPLPRIGVAIGSSILDLALCARRQLLEQLPDGVKEACTTRTLNRLMALGPGASSPLRRRLSQLLREGEPDYAWLRPATEACLIPMADVEMRLPAEIGDYTDFYASIHHATNLGRMFRPDNPLLPNYRYVPIGYHGRASSIVVSGAAVRRPVGQTKPEGAAAPEFVPSRRLDFELEAGFLMGPGNALGEPIPIDSAESHVFGMCLLNDWSARDIQTWEYQPLGPFLSKSFATSISPWIVTMEALAPFRAAGAARHAGEPDPLPYLASRADREAGGLDVTLEGLLATAAMRERGIPPVRLCRSSLKDLYWTISQLVAHHTSNGCNLRAGDLLATGTVSGPTQDALGSLIELTERGAHPLELPTGERRTYLEDGDEVTITAHCARNGFARIGFGTSRGIVLPARHL